MTCNYILPILLFFLCKITIISDNSYTFILETLTMDKMKYNRLSIFVLLFFTLIVTTIAQNSNPKPISGNKITKRFIKTHMDYPEADLQKNTQGTVKISFSTDKLGNVTNYSIIQKVSPSIDSSALSLFKLILWNPAIVDGKPVSGNSEFSLKYNTKSFLKLAKRRGYKHIVPPYLPVDTSGNIFTIKQTETLPNAILGTDYKSISDYIYKNLVYPEAASKLGLTGDVKLMFIIETNGYPSNIVAVEHLGGGCTEEAIRIIETMRWSPGIINNEAVRTSYDLTIKFKKGEAKDGYIPNQQGSGI